ncbi:response regulator transcription factor [Massilia yuzhufengensis]|uniref:Two component transcriptional regulator, LuxR family n=1 Tax=Massilia yuzhufengensis TaxID=1164594 RepID=A0A1I1EBE5_9BURK|nr:response regulator [Massilia yuzhufengensis]SFB82688.1 two component transcriptional regulator, LuxR family [Massilia yuzhufengensis]
MEQLVYVVDDDEAVRGSVRNLLEAEGYAVRSFASGAAFFDALAPDVPAELARRGAMLPIIFITGYGSIPMTVQAMKAGATEFLTKPVAPDELLRAVADALALDQRQHGARCELAELRRRHDSLTPRERETMELVIGGLLNKQVADALGVSEIMAKTHKRKVMEKMHARSLPDLVRGAERLQIEKSRSR